MKKLKLFEQQKEAIKVLKEFIKSDEKHITIQGVAGTGKTTIIRELFLRKKAKSKEYYIPSNVIGITVTHQARLNLQKSIPNSTTYASAANLVMEFDMQGEIYFIPKYGQSYYSELRKFDYIVVDECSQFSKEMIDILVNCTKDNAKFIWLGDIRQLPPIASGNVDPYADSPTFTLWNKYSLTEKVRQKEGDYIAELCDTICNAIDNGYDTTFIKVITNKFEPISMKGYAVSSIDKIIESYVRNFKDGVNVRITSYRNKRVDSINKMIREALWNDKVSNQYNIGEYIVMNNQYAPNSFPLAYNGQTFIILDIYDFVHDNIECYNITVNDGKGNIDLIVPTPKGYVQYNKMLKQLKNIALTTKRWDSYMNFKSQFADIAYAYCVTLYKIQGATLTGCYVDRTDIMSCNAINDKRKLQSLYVGASRPTNFLAIF